MNILSEAIEKEYPGDENILTRATLSKAIRYCS
jgi:hypothetical protein